jgi:hypothetical protein
MANMMLFGLSRSPELNGRTVRVLGDGFPNEQGRIAVQIEVEPPRTILVQPQNLGRRAHSKLVELIFSSPDVISTVVDRLCLDAEHAARGWAHVRMLPLHENPMHLGDLEAAALVCKSFATVVHGSDEFWKRLCHARWRTKFGFRARWDRALAHTEPLRWRRAFQNEESARNQTCITEEELHALTFDFRFWIGAHGDDGVVRTGLRRSVSTYVRLRPLPTSEQSISLHQLREINALSLQSARSQFELAARAPDSAAPSESDWCQGAVLGHPNGDAPLMRWFMLRGRVLQWGYYPHLWPEGRVEALASWGWQISNPNVCLRAIDDPDVHEDTKAASPHEEYPADGHSMRHANFDDLISTLDKVRLLDGRRVELPRSYIDNDDNWAHLR